MKLLTALAAACALAAPAFSAELGDPAPPLKIAEWVKGKPVDLAKLKGERFCVVEFWATWCPPCRASIPHLTEMRKKFEDKGVVFIGVSNEKPDVVKPFVEKMGDKMDYVVAVDDAGQTNKAYMEAYGINGIPHAFVIDKAGKVVWNCHPMDKLDEVLDQLTAGKFDPAAIKKAQEEEVAKAAELQKLTEEYAGLVTADEQTEDAAKKAAELGDRILSAAAGNADSLNAFAWAILTDENIKHRDLPLALKVSKAACDASGGKDAGVMDTYAKALNDSGNAVEAVKTEKQAIALCKEGDAELKAQLEATLKEYEKHSAEGAPKP